MKCIPYIGQIIVEYCYQTDNTTLALQTVPYEEDWLESKLKHLFSFWKGNRSVVGVEIEEAWKCAKCDFEECCDWRKQKAEECMTRNKAKM